MSETEKFLETKSLKRSKSGLWFRPGTKLTDGEIAQIVELFETNLSQADIARITKRDYKTIQKYHKFYLSGDLELLFFRKHKDSLSGMFTSEEKLDFFSQITKRCPGMTLKGMKLTFFLNFDQKISCSMIHFILTVHLGKSFKKTVPLEWARTQTRVIELHDWFLLLFFQFDSLFKNDIQKFPTATFPP